MLPHVVQPTAPHYKAAAASAAHFVIAKSHCNAMLVHIEAREDLSNEPVDFETRLFSGLELNVQQELRDNGAQITETGHPNPATFYSVYTLKNVRGRVQLSATRIGGDHYNVHADLDESGN